MYWPYQMLCVLKSVTDGVAVAFGTDWQYWCSQINADMMSCHAVFGEIAKAGIAVHSYDCHGHGQSEPTEERDRALIWHFHHVVRFWLALPVAESSAPARMSRVR